MIRAILSLLLSFALVIPAFGQNIEKGGAICPVGIQSTDTSSNRSCLRSRLPFPESWKYVSDFRDGDLAPEYAIGDARITPGTHFSVTRNATNPSTVASATGTVSVNTDSNVPRLPKSFANSTNGGNFVRGLMLEGSATNYCLNNYLSADTDANGLGDSWLTAQNTSGASTPSLIDASSTIGISGAKAQRLAYTSSSDVNKSQVLYQTSAVGSFAGAGLSVAVGALIKGTATGCSAVMRISEKDAGGTTLATSTETAITLSSVYTAYTATHTTTSASCSRVTIEIAVNGIDTGDVYAIDVTAAGIYKQAYVPSWVPCTTSALTRNAETFTIPTAGGNFPDRTGNWASSCDGTNDLIALGNVGNVSHIKIKFLSRPDNQEILNLQGSTATAVKVASGVLTFGASLSASNITIDGAAKSAADAGALINDNTWHTLEFDLTEIAGNDFNIGTDSSAYGDIIVQQLVINSPATHTYSFTEGSGTVLNDSVGTNHGTINGATWARDTDARTIVLKYRPVMMPNEQGVSQSLFFNVTCSIGNRWALQYSTNGNNALVLSNQSNGNTLSVSTSANYCSTWTRYESHTLIAMMSTTPFIIPALNSGAPIRMALFDNGTPIAYSTTYVPPVGALPETMSIQSSAGQSAIYECFLVADRVFDYTAVRQINAAVANLN
jgi:hypothetical protein